MLNRLSQLRIAEVSLVGTPAFKDDSDVWIFKSDRQFASIDGLQMVGKPIRDWFAIENLGDNYLLTAIPLAVGDPKKGGGTWTQAELHRLVDQWSTNSRRTVADQDGKITLDMTGVVTWVVTEPGDELYLAGAGDKPIPGGSWVVQFLVVGESPTWKELVDSANSYNGLAANGAAVITKTDPVAKDDDPDDDPNAMVEISPEELAAIGVGDDPEVEISPEELARINADILSGGDGDIDL